ncbi:MAG TPA: hypothetical protein VHA80_06645 [Solirubrobacterales bacterium]|nr:hypothetical protein [Solirubrobacterales bacterium]
MGQLNLLAEAAEPVEVPITPAVLRSGARAADDAGRPLFAHRHLPATPPALGEDLGWEAALDLAERALRGEVPTRAVLGLEGPCRYGGYMGTGGPGRPSVTASGPGVEVGLLEERRLVRWPRVFAALRERREVEPEVARARDLAEAYRLLDYYGRVYGPGPWGKDWTPVPLIRGLASEARALGGDPARLPQHTDYMREGVRS